MSLAWLSTYPYQIVPSHTPHTRTTTQPLAATSKRLKRQRQTINWNQDQGKQDHNKSTAEAELKGCCNTADVSLPIESLGIGRHFVWARSAAKGRSHFHVSNWLEIAELVTRTVIKTTGGEDGFRISECWIGRVNSQGSPWVTNVEPAI